MRTLLVRCGICQDWHNPSHHCGNCGAYHVTWQGRVKHFNRAGIEMVRALPVDVDGMLNRVIRRCSLPEAE